MDEPIQKSRRGSRRPFSVWIESSGTKDRLYRCRWVDPRTGQRESESCGSDRTYAKDRRDAIAAELREGKTGLRRDKTLSDLQGQIDSWMVGNDSVTRRITKASLARAIELVGDCRLAWFDRETVMALRAKLMDLGLRAATVNKEIRHLRGAVSLAVDAGWIDHNPLLRWKRAMMAEPEKRVRVVTAGEFELLVKACGEDFGLATLLYVAYYQGLRREDLAYLRWVNVDLSQGQIWVTPTEDGDGTKRNQVSGRPLRAIVADRLREWLGRVEQRLTKSGPKPRWSFVFSWPDGTGYKPDWLTHWFEGIVDESGVDKCTLHDLRRSFSTLAQRAGLAPSTVQELGGWRSLVVVKRHYTGDVSQGQRLAMRQLDAVDRPRVSDGGKASDGQAG